MTNLTTFTKLLSSHPISVGQVSIHFSGQGGKVVYFAVLDGERKKQSLSKILSRADVNREDVQDNDDDYDREIYSLLVNSPWFPLATGTSPQAALANLTEKINQPWLSDTSHLLALLVDRFIDRWEKRDLKDANTGQYLFHADMKYMIPESEKYR